MEPILNSQFTSNSLEDHLPDACRGLIRISSLPIPASDMAFVKSLYMALNLFFNLVQPSRVTHIIIGSKPFNVLMDNMTLTLTMDPNTLGCAIDHFVFLDYQMITNYRADIQVVTILEELAHSIMHVKDEVLVKKIVIGIYPAAQLTGETYIFPEIQSLP